MVYCEHVGTCLQEEGMMGEMIHWYRRTGKTTPSNKIFLTFFHMVCIFNRPDCKDNANVN